MANVEVPRENLLYKFIAFIAWATMALTGAIARGYESHSEQ